MIGKLECGPWPRKTGGFTFIEMVIVIVMLGILMAIAVPVYMAQLRSTREGVLKNNLATMRERLDQYRADRNKYPSSLQELVEGVEQVGTPGKKLKFLRRVPVDPMTSSTDWGLRSYQDEHDSRFWGGQNVFDVHSKSTGVALDGTSYRDW